MATIESPIIGQSDARDALVKAQIAKWSPAYALLGEAGRGDETPYSIVDMENAIRETVREIQNQMIEQLHDFANTLWSNENGGYDGRISAVRSQGRRLITAVEGIVGNS